MTCYDQLLSSLTYIINKSKMFIEAAVIIHLLRTVVLPTL